MASRVLSFPVAATMSLCSSSPEALTGQGADRAPGLPEPASAETATRPGPRLVHSRRRLPILTEESRSYTLDHARRIVLQVEQEFAARAQREALQREEARVRSMASGELLHLPPQATTVTLRHRLLDALLFFGRPA